SVHERPLDAVKHWRLVAFIDQADRHEQLTSADVEAAVDQEIKVRLLQLHFTFFLESFDDRVLDLPFRDEAKAFPKTGSEQQHESTEIESRVAHIRIRVLNLHVTGDAAGSRG